MIKRILIYSLLAIGGLWMWMFAGNLLQRPMLAFRDPYLRESLQSSGGH